MNATNEDTNTPAEAPKHDTPRVKTPKPKKAKAKPASVKKSAAKAEKKAKAKKSSKAKGDLPKGPAALKEYAPKYVKDKEHKTASGNVSVHCGDEAAKKLLGKSLDDTYAIVGKVVEKATDGEESEKSLRKKYAHLNVGMQRMNLGNRLRGIMNAK